MGFMGRQYPKSSWPWKNPFKKCKNQFCGKCGKMIQLTDLKICENCGNAFAKIIQGEPVNRCPACKVWKKENT